MGFVTVNVGGPQARGAFAPKKSRGKTRWEIPRISRILPLGIDPALFTQLVAGTKGSGDLPGARAEVPGFDGGVTRGLFVLPAVHPEDRRITRPAHHFFEKDLG